MEHWLDFLLPETASAPVRARTRYTIAGALAGLIEVCSILLFHFGAAPDLVLLGAVVGLVWLAWEFVVLYWVVLSFQSRRYA